ncbi:MAG: M48 family metallopeptidase [Acidiferrobacterales bacterium]|nr:M48 family metallopeptidase [Acidiferrobacterales bacterium]
MQANSNGEFINLEDLKIEVIRHPRRKRLSLEVGSKGILARAPEKMRLRTIEQFVHSKQGWIRHHFENRPAAIEPIKLCDGTKLKLLNEDIILALSLNKRGQAQLVGSYLRLPIIQTQRPIKNSIKDKLIRWYKQQALTCLRDKVAFFADEMSIDFPTSMNVKVRDYQSRWGSCDHKGDLSFNWRIIMAPESTVNYIVVHELAHLIEFNHSAKFWNIVTQQMPDWKQHQLWLNDNGAALYCI